MDVFEKHIYLSYTLGLFQRTKTLLLLQFSPVLQFFTELCICGAPHVVMSGVALPCLCLCFLPYGFISQTDNNNPMHIQFYSK